MYGRRSTPEPPKRGVWADRTRDKLVDIAKRKQELADEEAMVRSTCNHTYPDGKSALKFQYDDEGGGYNRCEVCNGI